MRTTANAEVVPVEGIEPPLLAEHDFESCASTSSATRAYTIIRSHNPEPLSGAIVGAIVGAMIRSHGSAKLPALVDGAGILYRRAAMASITQLFVCPQDWQSAPSGVLRLARLMPEAK